MNLHKSPGLIDILQGYNFVKKKIVCPYCQNTGCILVRRKEVKRGISGGKATGAIFTLGLSLLVTGLSRKERVMQAKCKHCKAEWTF